MRFTFRRRPSLVAVAVTSLITLGTILRFAGLDRSLWVDEASVANSVVQPTLGAMYFYEPWLQTGGPLFLLLVRLGVMLSGFSNWALRLIPFLSGALAVILMAIIVRRMRTLPGPLAVIAVAIVALSPSATSYSYTTKQYSSELFGGVAIMLAAICYADRPSRARLLGLAGTCILGLALGYGLVLLMPAVMLVSCPWFIDWWKSGRLGGASASRLLWWTVFGATVGAFFVAEYLYFGQPNSPPELADHWRLPLDNGLVGVVQAFLGFIYLALRHIPAWPVAISTVGMNLLAVVVLWSSFVALHLILKRKCTDTLHLAFLISGVSVLVVLTATLLGLYPMIERTTLMLLPCAAIIVTASLRQIDAAIRGKFQRRLGSAMSGVLCSLAAFVLLSGTKLDWTPRGTEDLDGAVSYLHEQIRPGDHVYVHAAGAEGFKLYSRMIGWGDPSATLGKVGQPCCPRIAESPEVPREEALRAELESAWARLRGTRMWVFSTARSVHWENVGADHNGMIREFLRAKGCSPVDEPPFRNLSLIGYGCAAGRHSGPRTAPAVAMLD